MNIVTVEKALYDWFHSSGLPVIWKRANTPRPEGAFFGLELALIEPIGNPWVSYESNSLTYSQSVNIQVNQVSLLNHGLFTGDGPLYLTSGSLPVQLSSTVPYWIIKIDNNLFKFATSFQDAINEVAVTHDIGSSTLHSENTALPAGKELLKKIQCLTECTLIATCYGGSPIPLKPYGTENPLLKLAEVLFNQTLTSPEVSIMRINSIRNIDGEFAGIIEPRSTTEIILSVPMEFSSYETFIETVNVSGTADKPPIETLSFTIRR